MAESSVRVEVGDGGGHSGDPLDPPPPPERSGRGSIVAVVVLALLAAGAAVFLLRPDAGEAADGSQRQATTTTTTTTTTPTTTVAESEAVDELDTPIPDGLEVVEVEGLGGSVSSFGFDIVRGPDGQYYGPRTSIATVTVMSPRCSCSADRIGSRLKPSLWATPMGCPTVQLVMSSRTFIGGE